jgi:hypothetical protein
VIDRLQFVWWQATAVGRIYQTDVALGPSIEDSLVIKLVINPVAVEGQLQGYCSGRNRCDPNGYRQRL